MTLKFTDFALAEPLQKALETLGFTQPTPVQSQAIPAALAGKDLLVSSQTGSGKTVAFLLPTLQLLAEQNVFVPFKERMKAITRPRILVLCPTRELAQQVSKDAIALVRNMKGVRVSAIMGGMPFGKQIQDLKGAQIVVATPGRLLDLVDRRQIRLDQVQALIVDEADRMLDLGFAEDLEAISDLAENRSQTLMFSATFADRIIALAETMMGDEPERIAIETGHSTNTDIAQTLHWTDGFEHKKKLLSHWLNDESVDQAVVFASTQEDTDMLAEELAEAGHSVVALHGAMPQSVRNRRLKSIRDGKAKILVATDVAARGLDVPTISHVINFGLPMKNEDYVHRVGRTGRAGRTGQAVTLATYKERGKIRALEEYLKTRLDVSEIEGLEPSPPPERPKRKDKERKRGRGGRENGREARKERGFSGGKRRLEGEQHFKRKEREEQRPQREFDRSEKPRFEREERPRREFKRDGQRSEAPRFAREESRASRFDERSRYEPERKEKSSRFGRESGREGGRGREFERGEKPRFEQARSARRFDENKGHQKEERPRREREYGADRGERGFDRGAERSERRFGRHQNTEFRFSQNDERGGRRSEKSRYAGQRERRSYER